MPHTTPLVSEPLPLSPCRVRNLLCTNSVVFPARNFIYKDIPQIQYKNHAVQIMALRNKLHNPVINVFFGKQLPSNTQSLL